MTYRVRFEAYALVQLHGLPSEPFDALLDRVVELVGEPWDSVVMPSVVADGTAPHRRAPKAGPGGCPPLGGSSLISISPREYVRMIS